MQVWGTACTEAGAVETAATIRLLLPTSVPPRLLLPALVAHLPHAQVRAAVCWFCAYLFVACPLLVSVSSHGAPALARN